jgi:membrane protease YdiL (CAAX protease family)
MCDSIGGMEQAASSPREQEIPVAKRRKRRDWSEIAIAYGLILSVVWSPRPAQRVLWVLAAAAVVVITSISFDGWKTMGFRAANFGRSLWIAGAALLLAVAGILIAARMHTLLLPGGPFAFVGTYIAYAIWTGVQQFLLQSFFLLRFLRVIRNSTGAALAASLFFAGAHVPNPVLVPMTFVWGLVACLLFIRYRNIFPLMIAHAILGITVAMTIPGPADHNMRVGLGYLTYRPHQHPHHHFHSAQP